MYDSHSWDNPDPYRIKYSVKIKSGMEPHFKSVLRSFDSKDTIQDMGNYYIVVTDVKESELKNFTSVKYMSIYLVFKSGGSI